MFQLAKTTIVTLAVVFFVLSGCSHRTKDNAQKVWTTVELKSLQGKTRDEVHDLLGTPNGMYTIDSKGRWHYSNILLSSEGAGKPRKVWVFLYFSQLGEQRVSAVDILEGQN